MRADQRTYVRRARTLALCLFAATTLSGCLTVRLKKLEIRQLEAELTSIKDTSSFLEPKPQLGGVYDGRLFLSGGTFNQFLAGLDNYEIPLPHANGIHLKVESSRLEFKDGAPTAIVQATALDASGKIELKVRVRADIIMVADPSKSAITLGFAVREIVPDVRIGFFQIRRWLFAGQILRLGGQQYIDALPVTTFPLAPDLPIDVSTPDTTRLELEKGWIDVHLRAPDFKLAYQYRAIRVLTLAEGVHVFFKLERTQ